MVATQDRAMLRLLRQQAERINAEIVEVEADTCRSLHGLEEVAGHDRSNRASSGCAAIIVMQYNTKRTPWPSPPRAAGTFPEIGDRKGAAARLPHG